MRQMHPQYEPPLLGLMSSEAIRTQIPNEYDCVLVPVGAIEQHGPHLPIVTDSIIGEHLCTQLAREIPRCLVAPVIHPGVSDEHASFPGTITVSADHLISIIHSYLESLDKMEFEHIILVPSHGGNFDHLESQKEGFDTATETTVITIADLDWFIDVLNSGLRDAGVDFEEPLTHAGAIETSLLLHMAPELVDKKRIPSGGNSEVSKQRLKESGVASVSDNGVLGDPSKASEEIGEVVCDTLVAAYRKKLTVKLD